MKRLTRSLMAVLTAAATALPFVPATAFAQSSLTSSGSGPAYVALGDSVAAGLGLGTGDPVCGRSAGAYAYKVAQSQSIDVEHIACSGATVGDLVSSQKVGDQTIASQLDQAFANGTPQLITITAGANDIHWADYFKKCYATTCGTTSDTISSAMLRSAMELKLDYALASIAWRSHGHPPKVVLTGYYNPMSAQCALADPAHFTTDEMNWTASQVQSLNRAIERASSLFSFARFAPVDFTGHDICSADSWVQTQGDPAPFHPKAAGQAVMAQAVIGKL